MNFKVDANNDLTMNLTSLSQAQYSLKFESSGTHCLPIDEGKVETFYILKLISILQPNKATVTQQPGTRSIVSTTPQTEIQLLVGIRIANGESLLKQHLI